MPSFDASPMQTSLFRFVGQLIGWPGVFAVAIALAAAGVWIGWPWLVAVGIAPIVLGLAPCLLMCGAMCAANLCMRPKQEKLSVTGENNKTAAASDSCCQSVSFDEPREKA
jgi:hypothetical protein